MNLNRILSDQHVASSETWRNLVNFEGEISPGGLVSLNLRGGALDLRHRRSLTGVSDTDFSFADGSLKNWEKNTGKDAEITLGMFGDHLRFTSRQASSIYVTSGQDQTNRRSEDIKKGKNQESTKRFSNGGQFEGGAELQRFDITFRDSESTRLSVFGSYSKSDLYFEANELSDRDDFFAEPNRKTSEFGGTVGLGPLALTLSRSLSRKVKDESGFRSLEHKATTSLDLSDLRHRADGLFHNGFWNLTPDSIWVSIARGQTNLASEGDNPADLTNDISFGLSWERNNFYSSVSYWRSFYDTRQQWAEDYDWFGDGADLSFGFNRQKWSFGAAFSVYRSKNLETTSRSSDYGYEGSLSSTLSLDGLPDLAASIYLGRYDTDYIAWGASGRTNSWEFLMTMDFSKYLIDAFEGHEPKLKVMYRLEGINTRDDFAGKSSDAGHVVGAVFQLKF